jgi:hypothetical protein
MPNMVAVWPEKILNNIRKIELGDLGSKGFESWFAQIVGKKMLFVCKRC